MKSVLGITYDLSQILQRNNQDIVDAIKFIELSKQRLQVMRDDGDGWNCLFEVHVFCAKNNILVPNMDDLFQL